MIITYNIGSLAARIRLTALKARHGGVIIGSNLSWRLLSQSALIGNQQAEYVSRDAQPTLDIPAGTYHIEATYQDKTFLLAENIELAKNTLTDAVFILDAAGEYDAAAGHHSAFDAAQDFERRLAERLSQEREFGPASGPLHDPSYKPQGEQGVHFQGHPLLNTAQFDGMEPKVNPQPSENEQASEKSLQLLLEKRAELQHGAKATPTLTR